MKLADIPAVRDASLASKLELIEALWTEVITKSDTLALPDWHVREIDQGLAEYEAKPRAGRPWNEIRDNLLGKQP